MNNEKKNNLISLCFYFVILVYTGLCIYLYYNQLCYPLTGLFEADTPVHVSMAVDDHFYYSVTAFIYLFFNLFPCSKILIATFLALATSGAVVLTERLLRKVADINGFKINQWVSIAASLALNFVMGFYVRRFNVQHYIGYQNANMWHNSTYNVMRFVALWCLIIYLDIYEDIYKKKTYSVRRLIYFSLVLALSVAVKPSFLTVFAPVMAIELLYDWLIKKEKFKNVFCFGITVIPSLIIMLLQSIVLFGEDTGNGYAISPFTALSQRGDHPKVTLILSILFPLVVFITHIKAAIKDRIYAGSLLVWLFGFLEVFLFTETGARGGDGNFFWGYSIALFVVFAESLIIALKDLTSLICKAKENADEANNDMENASKANAGKVNAFKIVVAIVCLMIFAWHAISGLVYFGLLLGGNTYFV